MALDATPGVVGCVGTPAVELVFSTRNNNSQQEQITETTVTVNNETQVTRLHEEQFKESPVHTKHTIVTLLTDYFTLYLHSVTLDNTHATDM